MTHPNADLQALQRTSVEIQACIGNMEDIVALRYEDIVEDADDA